jgi:hypothetical protein
MNLTNLSTGEIMTFELQSPEINELAKALVKAQAAMTSAKKDGSNPHFNSSFATLDSIWQAIRAPLTEHGLCVVQSLLPDHTLATTLLHESGQWVRSYQKLNPVKNDPQGFGSALTYGRRYSLAAIVGICQADDDGEAGSETTKALAKKPVPKPVPPKAEGNGGKSIDPMTRYWGEVKAAGLTIPKGQEILAAAGNDPSRAVDVLNGIAQA